MSGERRLFVAAATHQVAKSIAEVDMGLSRAEWGYLDHPHHLRGRAELRVHVDWSALERRGWSSLEGDLRWLAKQGKVSWVDCNGVVEQLGMPGAAGGTAR